METRHGAQLLTYDGAVHKGREFFGAISEVVAHRRKRQDNVQVLSDELNEELPAVFSIRDEPLRLDLVGHIVDLLMAITPRRCKYE